MVTTAACRSEDASPTTSKKLSRHVLHLVCDSQMGTREGAGRAPRSIWRQTLVWSSTPATIKKSARVAALVEKSRRGSCNQAESQQLCNSGLSLDEIQGSVDSITVAGKQEENDQPQDEETWILSAADGSSCRKTSPSEANNLRTSSNSIKKLTLSSLRPTAVIHPATPLKVPQPVLSIAKRTSLYQELREFRANADAQITVFPDYFSDQEKLLVQTVAMELQLGSYAGEKNIAVYKLLDGLSHCNRVQYLVPPFDNVAKSVYIDVQELAQHGKDGFIAKLRLQRLCSGTRNMLWDVAELSSAADGVADPINEGEGGVYALQSRSSGRKLALFKPAEEEKFVREGIYAGEGAVREEVAYVLDSRSNGFSGVPPTVVARLRLTNGGRAKQGAMQRFMASSIGSMESFGMSFDLEKAREFVSVEQVHRIALLDIRVFNTDRHPGNVLLIGDKKPYTMVPIDHGCILPSWFYLSEARFDWLEYPQSREALSAVEMQYINGLDAEKDAKVLRSLGIREECVATLKICTLLLQLAAAQGKTLFWMGHFMARDGCFQQPSRLEIVIQKACERAGIRYTFKPNEFKEEHGEIEIGVLSRRPPTEFFLALKHWLLVAIQSDESL